MPNYKTRVAVTRHEYLTMLTEQLSTSNLSGLDVATFRAGGPTAIQMLVDTAKQGVGVRLLVGIGDPSREPQVEANETLTINTLPGVVEEAVVLGAKAAKPLQARSLAGCHTKLWLFRRPRKLSTAIIGGRNLNMSDWHDLSVLAQDETIVDDLIEYFNVLWTMGQTVEPSAFIQDVLSQRKF